MSVGAARRGGPGLLLLAVSLLLLLGVALAWLAWPAEPAEQPAGAGGVAQRVAGIDVVHAADVLSVRAQRRAARLDAALMPGQEENLAQLLRMQAEAAQVSLDSIRFTPLPRSGLLQPVGMELSLRGAYYDLPIFVDGLFRQRWVVEITRITFEAQQPMAAQVVSRVEARFHRPVQLPADYLRGSVELAELDVVQRGFTAQALEDAARLAAFDAFLEQAPALLERSEANHRLVLRSIPRLVRQLPGSPMDWVGATFEGGEAHLTTDGS